MEPHLDLVCHLYRHYAHELRHVVAEQRAVYEECVRLRPLCAAVYRATAGLVDLGGVIASHRLNRASGQAWLGPGLDDLEAEITYLLVRHYRPGLVVEMSPSGGWSTMWILHALRDNRAGRLQSYDIVDYARRNVPRKLAEGRWELVVGDLRREMRVAPKSIDYLFVDCDHSAAFAGWYLENLVPSLRPGTPMSIHDIFHPDYILRARTLLGEDMGEASTVRRWLLARDIPHFTAAAAHAGAARRRVEETRRRLGLPEAMSYSQGDSMVYLLSPAR